MESETKAYSAASSHSVIDLIIRTRKALPPSLVAYPIENDEYVVHFLESLKSLPLCDDVEYVIGCTHRRCVSLFKSSSAFCIFLDNGFFELLHDFVYGMTQIHSAAANDENVNEFGAAIFRTLHHKLLHSHAVEAGDSVVKDYFSYENHRLSSETVHEAIQDGEDTHVFESVDFKLLASAVFVIAHEFAHYITLKVPGAYETAEETSQKNISKLLSLEELRRLAKLKNGGKASAIPITDLEFFLRSKEFTHEAVHDIIAIDLTIKFLEDVYEDAIEDENDRSFFYQMCGVVAGEVGLLMLFRLHLRRASSEELSVEPMDTPKILLRIYGVASLCHERAMQGLSGDEALEGIRMYLRMQNTFDHIVDKWVEMTSVDAQQIQSERATISYIRHTEELLSHLAKRHALQI